MITNYIIGILGIAGIMVLWVLVQILWKKVFSDHISDDDVLAERRSCGNCGCTGSCELKEVVKKQ